MKNKSALTTYTALLSCLVFLLSVNITEAQENDIFELSNNLKTSKSSISKNNSRSDFYNLKYKLHSTIYIGKNSIEKIYGKGKAKKLTFSDTDSFSLLNNNSKQYNDVELITITLSSPTDLNKSLNLSNTNKFTNLKYIFIRCYFKCTPEQIKAFVKSNSNVRVFYSNEIPS
jgi:hypothetical protein